MTSSYLRILALSAACVALACGGKDSGDETDGSSTGSGDVTGSSEDTSAEATGSTDASTGTTTDTTDTTSSTTGGTSGFVNTDTMGEAMCDIWKIDDCPEGEKCIPYAMGGGSWDALKCIDLDENPKLLGDECSAPLGGAGGQDDCDVGLFCYYIDSETNMGTCIAHCGGTPTSPTCEGNTVCTIVNDGVLTLCRPSCDPVSQDCEPTGSACWQATGTNGFTCIIDASGDTGAYGDACEYINACDPGLACADAAAVPDCTGNGCCTPFCDLNEPNNCPGVGQTCEAYYETPDPGWEHVGLCVLPSGDVAGGASARVLGADQNGEILVAPPISSHN